MKKLSMPRWSRMTISQKSIIVGISLLVLNSVALTLFFRGFQERYQLNALEDEAVSTAASLAEIARYGVVTRNKEVLNGAINGMFTKNIYRIMILDSDNRILAEAFKSGKTLSSEEIIRTVSSRQLNPSPPFKEWLFENGGGPALLVAGHPIEIRHRPEREEIGSFTEGETSLERIGSAVVVVNTEGVYREMARNGRRFLLVALLTIALGTVVIVAYVEVTAAPLKKLMIATQKVAEGEIGYKIEPSSMDEVGNLAVAFNNMTEKLKDTQDRLIITERLAASGRLAAEVAHEINNPLAIMKNYLYILRTKRLKNDDPNQKTLEIIEGEVDRVARIIRQFNDFYKGAQATRLTEVDLLEPLREVVAFCKDGAEEKGIVFEENLAEGGNVMGDKDKLKQVFLNIIKNSCEAMPDGGKVSVETFRSGGLISVLIKDTGVGIKKDEIDRIFDPFFSTKGIKGMGLGLSVTYGIIKSLNGEIEVESEEGKGTTFRVTLPVI